MPGNPHPFFRSITPRRRTPRLAIVLPVLTLGLVMAACGDGGNGTRASVTGSSRTPTATATTGTTRSLRDIDFTVPAIAGPLIDQAGGGDVVPERVTFADLTGDGVEEAVVVVESGGTLGDIGAGIYRLVNGREELSYFRKLAGRVEVRDGEVVLTEAVPRPGDPECCPSQLRETVIGWRTDEFEEVSTRVIDNPAGGGGR